MSERGRSDPWLMGLLCVGVFVYLWLGWGSHLLYYGFGILAPAPVFIWERAFARTALSDPSVRRAAGRRL